MLLQLFSFLYLSFFIMCSSQTAEFDNNILKDLKTLIAGAIPFRESDGKFDIPTNIKHIKLDIGLSYSAPMSQQWLSHEENLMVFGFEPNPAAAHSILQGAVKRDSTHGEPLKKEFIGKQFFLIPCALGLKNNIIVSFFVTQGDCGQSSIYVPRDFRVEDVIEVPMYSLSNFFDLFPFDTHPVIDYIKIDAQGSDLDIVKSAGKYLQERVIYITLEAEDSQYEKTNNSSQAIEAYMQSIGFVRYLTSQTVDPTYFNPRYTEYVKNHRVQIYQKG